MRCEVSDADVKGDVSSVELINDQFCVIILSRGGRAGKGLPRRLSTRFGARESAAPKEAKCTAKSFDVLGPHPKFGSKMACCSGSLLVLQGEYSKKSAKSLRAVKQVPTGSLRLKLRENQVYRGAQA